MSDVLETISLEDRARLERLDCVEEQVTKPASLILRDEESPLPAARGAHRLVDSDHRGELRLAGLSADDCDRLIVAARPRRHAVGVLYENPELILGHRQTVDRFKKHDPSLPRAEVLEARKRAEYARVAEGVDDGAIAVGWVHVRASPRVLERNEGAIDHWKRCRWVEIKKKSAG